MSLNRLVVATSSVVVLLFSLGCSSGGSSSSTPSNSTCGTANQTAEDKACDDCMAASCNSELTACYGAGYKTGNFSGPCGPVVSCQCSCPEGDLSCLTGCASKGEATCESCVAKIDSCESAKCASACGRTE